ncbi:hypothetical protein CLOACE_15350 [Clostridium acetireducens DSM 10703]|uniref:DUF2953 domain-containing protein n=1 Tax=Clostridium acetireducens DSM 10703 TaxID=1121290 RepID=A0A1E8EY38_9CLOT|nr:hypothetical protein [Clostridium acetireducens]OFI05840.1 hypothetical protein CLOACE_15350 [Clostridium acetireducens DSM 10703]
MNLFLFFVIIILLILLLIIIFPVKIIFDFNSKVFKFNVKILWLYPFFKATINENSKGILEFYLFNKKVLTKNLIKNLKYKHNIKFIKQIQPKYFNLQLSYGFKDPSITGVVCGSVYALSKCINITNLCNNPNFNVDSTYVNVSGLMEFNVISTGLKLLNLYKKNNLRQMSYANK